MASLWNPSIRKSIGIAVHGVLEVFQQTVLGFGVCPVTSDPTVVKITYVDRDVKSMASVPWVIEVFTLSVGGWRISSSNPPNDSIQVTWSQIVIDKFIYWFAFDGMVDTIDGFGAKKLIMSFDMTTQEIGVIDLPDSFAHLSYAYFSISKVHETLAVFEQKGNIGKQVCDVWMMDHGVPNLFTKLFTIQTPYESINILGFTNSGGPVMDTNDDYKEPAAIVFYEPCSEHFNNIGIYGKHASFFVGSYMETLLLVDQLNCKVYAEDDDDR